MAVVFGCWLYDFLGLIVALIAVTYAFFTRRFQYWKKRDFPQLATTFPEGNYAGVNRTISLELKTAELYEKSAGLPLLGAYIFSRPLVLIRDVELAKNILIKEFGSFRDRGFSFNLKQDPLAGHLFLMNGQEWRNLRIKLTPTFTSGKMKMMFPTIVDVGKKLETVLEDAAKKDEVEIKDILSRFTTDVISSVAFGIEANSLDNPDVEFRKMGNEISHPNLKLRIMNLILFSAPWLAKHLPIRVIPAHISDFFIGIVQDTMDYRIKNSIHRNDFFQLLLQLKTLGYVKDADHPENDKVTEHQQKFTVEQAAAQAFLFFFAGFETSSATMQFALYELSKNPNLQDQLRKEIDAVLAKNDGKLTYEGVMSLDLLDRVVDETLRMYPVAATLLRECNEKYKVPGTDYTILPGDSVWFPIYAYHHDPQYYPEPKKFDPDRFLPENKENRPTCAYMPFGEGPRNCIGNRFGLMQTKIGLSIVLSKFRVTPSKNTPIPMVFDPQTNILTPKGGMPMKISKR